MIYSNVLVFIFYILLIERNIKMPLYIFYNFSLLAISQYIITTLVQTNSFHPDGQKEDQI